MTFSIKNNAESTVNDNPLSLGATTLNVATGEGANFPSTYPFRITIWNSTSFPDPGEDSGMEIVECTSRTADALTIVRGCEGTADVEHTQDEKVAQLVTAGIFDDPDNGIYDNFVEDSDYNADTILKADTNNTPTPITISENTIVGRIAAGNITALTAGQTRTIINVEDNADVTDATNVAAAGAIMDSDFSEDEGFMRKTGAGTYVLIKSNLNAAVAPTVNDDSGDDYGVGSRWLNTTDDKEYVCSDATVGAAVWSETTIQGSDPLIVKSVADAASDINSGAEIDIVTGTIYNWSEEILAKIIGHTNLDVARGASIFDSTEFIVSKSASIFNDANLSVSKSGSIFDHTNLSVSKGASIFDSANLTSAKSASIFEHANLTLAKLASIVEHANLTVARGASIFDHANLGATKAAGVFGHVNLSVSKGASIFDDANLTSAKSASIFDDANLTSAKSASIFDDANLTATRGAPIFSHANLTVANVNLICDHANLTSDREQAHLYQMVTDNVIGKIIDVITEGQSDVTISVNTQIEDTTIYKNLTINAGVTLTVHTTLGEKSGVIIARNITNNGTITRSPQGAAGGMRGRYGGYGGGGLLIIVNTLDNNSIIEAPGQNAGWGHNNVGGNGLPGSNGAIYRVGSQAVGVGGAGGGGTCEVGGGGGARSGAGGVASLYTGGVGGNVSYTATSGAQMHDLLMQATIDYFIEIVEGKAAPTTPQDFLDIYGGGGGSGTRVSTGKSGAGGGNGGELIIACDTYDNTGGTIKTPGGNGCNCESGDDHGGGGGGGGGGIVYVIYRTQTAPGTLSANGGAFGTGGSAGCAAGSAGSAGATSAIGVTA